MVELKDNKDWLNDTLTSGKTEVKELRVSF